jgi:HPt (histidine-containing phosphotransfer) domain-containing protein
MRSTSTLLLRPQSSAANDGRFEELRHAYYARLSKDRTQLATFSAQLAHADTHATAVYDDIRQLARRMAGAAAIFDEIEIGNAAISLEQATLAAVHARADNSDSSVWTALERLVDLLRTADDHHRS